MEVGGGGGDNRVSQASASSVVRLDKVPSRIVETQWNGIVQNIAFIIVSRVLTMPSPSLTQFGSPRRGWVKVAWQTLHRKDSPYRKNSFHDSVQQDQPLRQKENQLHRTPLAPYAILRHAIFRHVNLTSRIQSCVTHSEETRAAVRA